MLQYGLDPSKLAFIVSVAGYNDLIGLGDFADITQVGSELATKVQGQVGSIFGTPVVVTPDLSSNKGAADTCALLVYNDN